MPWAAPHPCGRCGQLVERGATCPCRPAWENRPRAARQGGTKWRNRRRSQLRMHPICQVDGCRWVATEVDHIIPLSQGGDEFAWENLFSICAEHHRAKTVAESARVRWRR